MRPDVRRILVGELSRLAGTRVGVMLSGGIDSASVLFSLLELGCEVHAYTFQMAGVPSTDSCGAVNVASKFGVEITTVELPTDHVTLIEDLRCLARYGARTKTDFECSWPFLYTLKFAAASGETDVVTGHGADGHFCISKKGMIHFRDTRIDEFRKALFVDNPRYAQRGILDKISSDLGVRVALPYLSRAMYDEFVGTTWDQVNRPRQKDPILRAYPEKFRRVIVRKHTNLQLGDSGIAEHFRIAHQFAGQPVHGQNCSRAL